MEFVAQAKANWPVRPWTFSDDFTAFWLDNTFENEKVKAMLAAECIWTFHPIQRVERYFPTEGMANQAFGMALGKGGAQCLTDSRGTYRAQGRASVL